ncbi:hypothetical protein O988_03318 [Pseudogymnoascus sp. VKM F-3808]|nr:hypothetical protein O988_03318 [Pseudogymnoascus sp. VKM F-3808]
MDTETPRLRLVLRRQAEFESDADSDSESQPERETYPTFSELCSRHVKPYPTLAAVRIVWSFRGGSLETSLSVMAAAYNIDVLEPYFQQSVGRGSNTPWHVVSKSPVTHPPVSEIRVNVFDLDIWESDWLDFHENHSDPDFHTESDTLSYGTLPDYDPENDKEPPHLLKCCGTDRPRGKEVGVLVTASPSGPGFVTVHEYVTTVHPWLMRNREDIFKAMNCWEQMPYLEGKDLVVDLVQPNFLKIDEKSDWAMSLSMRRSSWMDVHERETSDISYPIEISYPCMNSS